MSIGQVGKAAFRRLTQSFGVDVRLVRNLENAASRTWEQKQDAMWRPFLEHRDIRTVVDVGANIGQFASMIHRQCPSASVISFEPLKSCEAQLQAVLDRIPGSRLVRAAVGAEPGTASMNVSDFTPCSSLLAGTNLLGEDYAAAAEVSPEEVPIVRVDDALADDKLEEEILVKFDVQGFEIPAMSGAIDLLSRASIVVCEVCFFRKLYEGQPLFDEIHAVLLQRGFRYMGNAEQHIRKSDGRIVEADAVFERVRD